MSEKLQDIIERVKAGSRDRADIQAIAAAIESGQLLLEGNRVISIQGDVNAPVVAGDRNVIGNNNLVIYGADAEVILEVLRTQGFIPQLSGILMNPPLRGVKRFIGREQKLQVLHEQVQQSQQIVAIEGMGGVGKTELALKYISEYKQHDNICWFNARDTNLEAEISKFFTSCFPNQLEEFEQLKSDAKILRFWKS